MVAGRRDLRVGSGPRWEIRNVACEGERGRELPLATAERRTGWKATTTPDLTGEVDRLADCFADGRPPRSPAHRCRARCSLPRSCGDRLRSPSWDEVTVSRSGGTTIGCGAPSSGRDSGRNVARRARRHRRLCGPSQQSAHRAERRVAAPVDGVATSRLRLPAGQVGHAVASVRARGERAMASNDVDVCFIRRGHTPSTRATGKHCSHMMSRRPWSHWTMIGVYPTCRHDESRAKAPSSVEVCHRFTSSASSRRRVASAASQPVAAAWAAG